MTREKIETELKRLLLDKEKQETKLKEIQRQLDRLVYSWKSIETPPSAKSIKSAKVKRDIKVTDEERNRRSERMKKYWANYRKAKPSEQKSSAAKK